MYWESFSMFIIICLTSIHAFSEQGISSQNDPRIVGGADAVISSFPYQVSIRIYNAHICGGAIFHPSYVITAAHCLIRDPTAYSVKVGTAELRGVGVVKRVCFSYPHKNFNAESMDNDVGLLKLCEPLEFSDTILPIYIPEKGDIVRDGSVATISGWGHTTENGKISLTLQKVHVPTVPRRRCKQIFNTLTPNMICAGYNLGGKDACQGDSGGPMMVDGKLFGVVSWGAGCGQPQMPGVYTFLPNYRDWIRKITNY